MNIVNRPSYNTSQAVFEWNEVRLTVGDVSKLISDNSNTYVAIIGFYILFLLLLPKYFSSRQGFDLRRISIVYNITLSLFSLFGAVAMTGQIILTLQTETFYETYCRCYYIFRSPSIVASLLFPLSKPVELIDTFIILLRRRDVIFLHWYHHITTIMVANVNYVLPQPPGLWCMWMNYSVHFLMYGYYGLMLTPAKKLIMSFSIVITSLQILQMILAVALHGVMLYEIANGTNCDAAINMTFLNGFIYLTYCFLFIQYFTRRYANKNKVKKQ